MNLFLVCDAVAVVDRRSVDRGDRTHGIINLGTYLTKCRLSRTLDSGVWTLMFAKSFWACFVRWSACLVLLSAPDWR